MPGFDFTNYNRNAALHARGAPLPKATSTGTTIVGCIYDKGVVVSGLDSWAALRCGSVTGSSINTRNDTSLPKKNHQTNSILSKNIDCSRYASHKRTYCRR
jgi:hypothetical protein